MALAKALILSFRNECGLILGTSEHGCESRGEAKRKKGILKVSSQTLGNLSAGVTEKELTF